MAKRGRKPKLLPPGVRRRELKRHEIRIWRKDAPDDPPTLVIKKTKSIRPVGRPKMSHDRAKALLGLRIATAIYVERGAMLKEAVPRAMELLRWPDQSAAEVERIMARFRARRRN
jgi:hypothetical protein